MEPSIDKDGEPKHRHRLKGLFNKIKASSTDAEVNDFLHGPSDKLTFDGQTPLSPIDTSTASRWPAAKELAWPPRSRTESPKRSRKGLSVHFSDGQPEIIGEGGDEAEAPTADIGRRKRAYSHPTSNSGPAAPPNAPIRSPTYGPDSSQMRYGGVPPPPPVRRAQTGNEGLPRVLSPRGAESYAGELRQVEITSDSRLTKTDSRDPTSFAARVRADMAAGEGRAFRRASRVGVETTDPGPADSGTPPPDGGLGAAMNELQINTMKNLHIPSSPGFPPPKSSPRPHTPENRERSMLFTESPESLARKPTVNSNVTTTVTGDDALKDFSGRTAHLTTLFRLSAEAFKPIPQSSPEDIVRAALWWFLRGRSNLEITLRGRSTNSQAQQANSFLRQQAYADLAKSLWLVVSALPQCQQSGGQSSSVEKISESRFGILTNLRKLCLSMQRNNILPPLGDEALLTQGLDCAIWLPDEGNRSLPQNQRQNFVLPMHDTFPIGDTTQYFHYLRVFAKAVLVEEAYPQQYLCPVLVSIVRGHEDTSLRAIIASQNGAINLCIPADDNRGPVWDDVSWWPTTKTIDIKLPRGFKMQIQCVEQDFRSLLGIYDHYNKTYSSMDLQKDEEIVFETLAKTSIDQSGPAPREPLTRCRVILFEKSVVLKAASGSRTMHRGFRFALVTGPKIKVLKGINQDFPSSRPLQLGLRRSQSGESALVVVIDEKVDSTLLLTFDDIGQPARLHSIFTGTALKGEERVVCSGKLKIFSITNPASESSSSQSLKFLDWQSFTVINSNPDDFPIPRTIQSDHLRVVLDFKTGTLSDRINVGAGELSIRLAVNSSPELKILRLPQQDLSISLSEGQVSKELHQEITSLSKTLATTPSIRTYTFASLPNLHAFQTAITGFTVLFDAVASSFAISRRRMVVPIHKKWDAARTRIQIVRRDKVVLLVAFFENFSHGEALNMVLKSTDVFESTNKGGKYSLRIVDAKFALPRTRTKSGDGDGGGEKDSKPLNDGKGDGTGKGAEDVGFVSLDLPEYPGEHDDITIFFDGQNDLDGFIEVLPAPAKTASRLGSVTRR